MLAMAEPTTQKNNEITHHDVASHDVFMWVIGKATARAQRANSNVAVIIFDVGNVPTVIDFEWQLGERLAACARAHDTVGQLGACTYGVVVDDITSTLELEIFAKRLGDALEAPLLTANGGVVLPAVRASITMLGTPDLCNRQ